MEGRAVVGRELASWCEAVGWLEVDGARNDEM